ncbi:MAG TPA: hypothetical protein VFM29_01740 [Vicinamibacteria bacterium]|nr:hypothetical protein [Vicinamibacteria bacterium]
MSGARPSRVALGALGAAAGLALWSAAGGAAQAQVAGPVVTTLTLFAGTPAGLWRSQDWGAQWQRVTGNPRGVSVESAGAAHTVLAVGPRVWVGFEKGLFVSDDFGDTWAATPVESPVHAVLPSRYPQADPTVFAGTAAGLLKSDDGGRSFHDTPLRGVAVTRVLWPGPALVVATGEGVRFSVDAATTFAPPGAGMPKDDVGALALSSFFAVDPVAFAGVGARGVLRTADGGKTWAPSGLDGHRVTDLEWLGPFLYAATDKGLFRSQDAGATWAPLGEGLSAVPRRFMFPLAPDSGAEAFVATESGIFRTSDGGARWMPVGLEDQRVLCVGTFPPPEPMKRKKGRR